MIPAIVSEFLYENLIITFPFTVWLDADLASKTKKRSLLLSENVTPVRHSLLSPQLNEASENSGLLCDLAY